MWEGGARRRWMISSPTTCHRGIASGSGSGDGCSGTARRRRVVTLQHPARGRQRSKMPSAEASRRLVEMLPHARPRGLTSSWEAGILSPNIDRGSSLSALRNKDNSAIAKHGSSLPLSVEPVLCRLNLEKIATTLNQLEQTCASRGHGRLHHALDCTDTPDFEGTRHAKSTLPSPLYHSTAHHTADTVIAVDKPQGASGRVASLGDVECPVPPSPKSPTLEAAGPM